MKWNRFMRTNLSKRTKFRKEITPQNRTKCFLTLNLRWKMRKSFIEMNKKKYKRNSDENMDTNSGNDHKTPERNVAN